MWRELVYYERIVGAPRKLALHTATLGNARILGLGDETGSIEVGKAADLIVLEENPLENLETLRQLKMVMARGKLVSGLSVKHLARARPRARCVPAALRRNCKTNQAARRDASCR